MTVVFLTLAVLARGGGGYVSWGVQMAGSVPNGAGAQAAKVQVILSQYRSQV